MAATTPDIMSMFKVGRGEGRCQPQMALYQESKSISEAFKRFLLGLIILNLVIWPCLAVEFAGEVGTQLFHHHSAS